MPAEMPADPTVPIEGERWSVRLDQPAEDFVQGLPHEYARVRYDAPALPGLWRYAVQGNVALGLVQEWSPTDPMPAQVAELFRSEHHNAGPEAVTDLGQGLWSNAHVNFERDACSFRYVPFNDSRYREVNLPNAWVRFGPDGRPGPSLLIRMVRDHLRAEWWRSLLPRPDDPDELPI